MSHLKDRLSTDLGHTFLFNTLNNFYLQVEHVRSIVPNVSLSSDFICGFCSESESEFQETLTLLENMKYNFCFLFPYRYVMVAISFIKVMVKLLIFNNVFFRVENLVADI